MDPSLGLTLGISPVSSSSSGSDMQSQAPTFTRGAINFGGAMETPVSGLIRDGALILALAIGGRYLWGKL